MNLLLIRRTARVQWAALLTLGLLVLLSTFLVDAGPRTLVARYDRAAHDAVAGAPASADLIVNAGLQPVSPDQRQYRATILAASAGGLAKLDAQWRARFPKPLRDTIVATDHSAGVPFVGLTKSPYLEMSLSYSATAGGHIRYVAGHAPGAPEHPGGKLRLEAALPVRTAQRMGIKSGDVVTTVSEPAYTVHITGLFAPADPASGYWTKHPQYRDVAKKRLKNGEVIFQGTALVEPPGYHAICAETSFPVGLTWTYTPGAGRVSAAAAPELSDDVHQASESISTAQVDIQGNALLTTSLDHILDDYVGRLRTTQTLLSLSLAGLFAAAIGVLVLVNRLLLTRLRTGLSTQAARGASRTHLAGLTGGLAALVTLPAAAAGLALSILFVPGPEQSISLVGAALLVVTAIAVPAVIAGRRRRGPSTRRRARLAAQRRAVAEGLVVVLAVAGTYVLRQRGLTTETWSAGVDPLLSVVPALLAVAGGLVILRVLPYPLRLAGRIFARGRSAAPFVGVARASRQDATAVLPLVILLLAVAVVGFGTTVESSLENAQRRATYQSVGGDARVDSLSTNPAIVDRVRHSPGVRSVVAAQVVDQGHLVSRNNAVDDVRIIGIDLTAYRRMMAGSGLRIPTWPKTAAKGPVPALFSASARDKAHVPGLGLSTDYGQQIPVRDVGTVPAFPSQPADSEFVLVPAAALSRATGGGSTGTASIFVRGDHIDAAALRRNAAQPGVDDVGASTVWTYQATHDALTEGELGHLVGRGFGVSGVLVAGYGALAVLVILFAGAQARGRTVSYLRTLGLSRRQSQLLAFVEIAPTLFAAAITGWVLGLVLPTLLGPAIDLRPYTGGFAVTHYAPDLGATVALAGGLLVFAGLAVLVDTAAAARRGLGGVLRIGDT